MGEHRVQPNGLLPDEAANVTRILDGERWAVAEARTAELIECIQPSKPSEERRNAVAKYVQELITKCISCKVFAFGSVPLKTYLPDGDIDLTACSENESLKDTWAIEVRDMLASEEKSETAEFRLKEVYYIQAEVKIIKCLVENIVVDISFNQVGGLCTLCFLEEIDHLINQKNLFKRSVILIKAWCYYESRILGAHHGLISTYALEILVLYIFHVFNNTFAGPLEVLYRFLEFFSNFDWDNYCVSLWGPVPICSLPDMTAQPPRRDGGELLLSKLFLNACSSFYGVQPENQSQPFVSKYFNVIDPLRTNNNLGRSVSKGNFYRIRSAFALGAKRLARLLECPKDTLIAEVNQFFTTTWERHGSGLRPDAPSTSLHLLRPLHEVPVDEIGTIKTSVAIMKGSADGGLATGNECQVETRSSMQGPSSQEGTTSNQNKPCNTVVVAHARSQKSYDVQTNSKVPDQFESSSSSSASIPVEKAHKNLRSDYTMSDHQGRTRFQFARTRSSPDLTDASAEVLARGRRSRINRVKEQINHAKVDYVGRKKNLDSEISSDPSSGSSFADPSSVKLTASHHSVEVATNIQSDSNNALDDAEFTKDVFASGREAPDIQHHMHQEQQDSVNSMASARMHNFGGQVQFPMHLASHLSFQYPSLLASVRNGQRNMPELVPSNIPMVDPSWGLNVQFPQGVVSSPSPQYVPMTSQNTNADETLESGNESSGLAESTTEDGDHGLWHENDTGGSRRFVPDNGAFQNRNFDERQQSASSIPPPRVGGASAPMRSRNKFSRENRGQESDKVTDILQHQSSRANDSYSVNNNSSSRLSSASQATSSRSKVEPDNGRDGSSAKVSKSARDKWGKKPLSSAILTALYGKPKAGWHKGGSPDHVPIQDDNDNKECVASSTTGIDISERNTGSEPADVLRKNQKLPSYDQEQQISSSDQLVPYAPVTVGSSRQRATDNPAVFPLRFYPTGPPVPFITIASFYNVPTETGNSDASASQFDRDDSVDHSPLGRLDQNLGSVESADDSEVDINVNVPNGSYSEPPDGDRSDILNSDFVSHWQNLQYGRLCQNTRYQGQMIYPSVMVPPVYLQGHFPWGGPGRPVSTNANLLPQMMNYGQRLVPVAPIQPGPSRPAGVFHRYGDEAPRFRGGTGTYLPNPKPSYRDRQSSSTRNHRGSYNYHRSDHGDREGDWVNTKSRAGGRGLGKNLSEKQSPRFDRSITSDSRHDHLSWESYRHNNPISSNQAQTSAFGSNSTSGSASMQYGVYPLPVSSNGVGLSGSAGPPVVMIYPYDQSSGSNNTAESLEFGSLGPVQLPGAKELLQHGDENQVRKVQQRDGAFRGGSSRSSPDQPSSPQVHRGV